jgi:hypothetical protein
MAHATRLLIKQSRITCVLCSKLNWLFCGGEPGFEPFLKGIFTDELSCSFQFMPHVAVQEILHYE